MFIKSKAIKDTLNSLVIFKSVKYSPALNALLRLCDDNEDVRAYSDFIGILIKYNLNLTEYIKSLVFTDENIFTELMTKKQECDFLYPQVKDELDKLFEASKLDKSDFSIKIRESFLLFPIYNNESFTNEYFDRIKNIHKIGFGIFANNYVFGLDEEGVLCPSNSFNIRKLDNMYNYDRERKKVIDNTRALVEGKPCCNVLLYGDAGTGKSSSIKAIANEFFKDGLRLIEINKTQVADIPKVVAKLSNNPLKFIIFIDDVTFSTEDPDFCALKTILDGDSKGLSENMAVYITSNHRHLIKETASEREGDIINANDNIQGILGLCARFGLTVTYMKPDKFQFTEIVTNLAKEKGIEFDEKQLMIKAEAFAIRNGGRTPRCAKQFIDLVYSGVEQI